MPISYKEEFVGSLCGGVARKGDDPPGYRSPHRRTYPDGVPLPPSSAELMAARGQGRRVLPPRRDTNGRFTGRAGW